MAKLGIAAPPRLALPRLRALREARHLSQVALAARAGLNNGMVSRFELGLYLARPHEVAALAAALGVAPAELTEPGRAGDAPPSAPAAP